MEQRAIRRYIPLKNKWFVKKVFVDDILFIETDKHYLFFTSRDGVTKVRGTTALLRSYAEGSRSLYLCHSYLAINLSNVICMEREEITFVGGASRSLGKKNFRKAREAYEKYLEDNTKNP